MCIWTLEEDGSEIPLFNGVIDTATLMGVGGYNRFEIELSSGTSLMDREKCNRSFQNINQTYEQIVEQVVRDGFISAAFAGLFYGAANFRVERGINNLGGKYTSVYDKSTGSGLAYSKTAGNAHIGIRYGNRSLYFTNAKGTFVPMRSPNYQQTTSGNVLLTPNLGSQGNTTPPLLSSSTPPHVLLPLPNGLAPSTPPNGLVPSLIKPPEVISKLPPTSGTLKMSGIVQSRINIANGQTRFTPIRPTTGKPVSAGFNHVLDGHFNRPLRNSRSIFSISVNELKTLLQSNNIVQSPVKEISGGQYVRMVDTGKIIGNTALKFGGHETTWMQIFTDKAGNLITAYPIPTPY